jgi:glycyl-tRNA synthetase (class II)
VASGHVGVFTDPLVECLHCHKRFREDHLLEAFEEKKGRAPENGMLDVVCPNCGTRGQWTPPRDFNMMLQTHLGPVQDDSGLHYLRPETAQGIFTNFANVLQASRMKPPFGIGRSASRSATRSRRATSSSARAEFEQMELEFFVEPGTDDEWFQYWLDYRWNWYIDLGVDPENLRLFEHPKDKLSHYSKRTIDIEYRFGFTGGEWGELEGVANRTNFDLTTHSEHSGKDLSYFDQSKNERWVPYVIEPCGRPDPLAHGLPRRRVPRRGGAEREGRRRLAHRAQARPPPCARQGRGAPAEPQRAALAAGPRGRGITAEELERRLRRRRRDRSPIPPPGRDRHPRSASPSTSTRSTTTR